MISGAGESGLDSLASVPGVLASATEGRRQGRLSRPAGVFPSLLLVRLRP